MTSSSSGGITCGAILFSLTLGGPSVCMLWSGCNWFCGSSSTLVGVFCWILFTLGGLCICDGGCAVGNCVCMFSGLFEKMSTNCLSASNLLAWMCRLWVKPSSLYYRIIS